MLQLSCFKMPCFAELRMDRTSFSGHAMTARSSIGRSVGPFPSVSLLEAWTHGFLHLFVTEKGTLLIFNILLGTGVRFLHPACGEPGAIPISGKIGRFGRTIQGSLNQAYLNQKVSVSGRP